MEFIMALNTLTPTGVIGLGIIVFGVLTWFWIMAKER